MQCDTRTGLFNFWNFRCRKRSFAALTNESSKSFIYLLPKGSLLGKVWGKTLFRCEMPCSYRNRHLTCLTGSNILRSSLLTTLWYLQVKHKHLKTNLQGLLCHLQIPKYILIFSKSNLKLLSFFRVLFALWSSKYPHPEPANTTSIHRVKNIDRIVTLFHLPPKSITQKCRSLSWKPVEARWM